MTSNSSKITQEPKFFMDKELTVQTYPHIIAFFLRKC